MAFVVSLAFKGRVLAALFSFSQFLVLPTVHGQQDTSRIMIDGRVVSRAGDPIPNAEATILGGHSTGLTDGSGQFHLSGAPGTLVLRVRRIGFRPQYLRLNLGPGAASRIEVMLDPGPQMLPDVDVSAKEAKPVEFAWTTKYDDFFRRRNLGMPGGTFISAEDLRRRPAIHTAELIEQYVPGARVIVHSLGPGGTEIKFPRCSGGYVSVWIDGRKINWASANEQAAMIAAPRLAASRAPQGSSTKPTELADVLDDISPTQIQFMEVYRGIGSIPGEFSGGCGAIAIWTK